MEKKKLKLNIVDFVVILAVAALVVFLGAKVAGSVYDPEAASNLKTCHIRLYHAEVADYVIANTNIGDPAYDATYANELGTVVDIQVDEAAVDEVVDGKFVTLPREGYSSVHITVEVQAEVVPHGVTIDDMLYSVGHTMVLHAGGGKYYLPIDNIEVLD